MRKTGMNTEDPDYEPEEADRNLLFEHGPPVNSHVLFYFVVHSDILTFKLF